MKTISFCLIFLLLLTACAATDLKPVTDETFAFREDEKRLWLRSQEEQAFLNQSGLLYDDPQVEAYLNQIATQLQPPEVYRHIPIKVRILRDAYLNAFAYPNGVIYVHTGIIARAENEAQMATLLAHEMTHCTHRHAAKNFRAVKNNTAFLAAFQTTVGGIGGGIGSLANVLGSLGTIAATTGYSRELETEADMVGFRLIANAGYDPREAPKLFVHLKEELSEENIKEPYFFGSHPQLDARIANYEALIDNDRFETFGDTKNAAIFQEKIKRVILDNAVLDIKLGRFEHAQRGIEKYLALVPEDAAAYFYLGEAFNQRGGDEDIQHSIRNYEKSIALDPASAQAYRKLGLAYYKNGENFQASKYLRKYLTYSPQAADRKFIEYYLEQIDTSK
ncbi:MAG: M48 family metalloprotease [Desulfatitalea sp.]|nr:M48 family metalloprotease [Desulfatitalea sp.]NNK02478.1 M48 family metalloprotease [Desulfatitalea sp.]